MAAWLGWCFDGLDGYLYVLVATRFVRQLLERHAGGVPVSEAEVSTTAALVQCFFLIGWAVGGAVFGRIGDRLGRARTLTLTVLTYATFTGLTFFADSWWQLLIFRFIAALGIGGEWAAGAALVSETLHARHKVWASAALQSGYMVGCIAAALTTSWMSGFDPRWVFLVGVAPAFLTLWVRWAVPEPENWQHAASSQKPPGIGALFKGELARTTILVTLLTSIALTTVWSFLFFIPQVVRAIPEIRDWSEPEKQALISRVTIAFLLVNIAANFFGTYLARWVGYRRAFFFMIVGGLITFLIGYRVQPGLDSIYLVACSTACFGLGVFGMFPGYIPPLFPVLLRTLGAGFTYNVGRLASAAGALLGGEIVATAGGPSAAIWWTAWLYIPGLLVCLVLPLPPRSEE